MRILNRSKKGYTIQVSARDTRNWARRPLCGWPGSALSGRRFMAVVDSNGLVDFTVDGHDSSMHADDIDGAELDACIADHLPKDLRHLWPVWDINK